MISGQNEVLERPLISREQIGSGQPERNRPSDSALCYAAFLIFLLLYFLRPEDFIPGMGAIPLKKLVGIITGITLVFPLVSGATLPKVAKLLLLLFALMLVSIPQSLWVGGSFDLVVNGFAKNVLVVLAAAMSVANWDRLRQSVTVQTLIIIALAAISLKGDAQNGRQYGAGNMFSDPNDFALNAVMVLPFAVFNLRDSNRLWKRFGWVLGTVLLVTMIVSSGSRGGFIALCVSAMLLAWKMRSRKSIGLLLCVTAAALLLFSPAYRERMTTIFDTDRDKLGSAQARQELLKRSIEVTFARPLLGVGPGQFQEASGAWHETHNTFTQLSAECGIAALFIFLMMAQTSFSALRNAMSNMDRSSSEYMFCWSIFCSVIAYLVGGFFLSTTYWLAPYVLFVYAANAGSLALKGAPQS